MTRIEAFKAAENLIAQGIRVKVGADFGVWYCRVMESFK